MQMKLVLPQLVIHRIENEFANTPHAHDAQFQVTVPMHGTCFFTHENKDMALKAGNGLILQPGDKHSFSIGEDAGIMIIQVGDQSIHPSPLPEWREPPARQQFDPVQLSEYFKKWMVGMVNLDRVNDLAVEEFECQVLAYLHQTIWGAAESLSSQASQRSVADRYLIRALEYVHAHYTERMNIDQLACIALQSRFHFIRSFKAMTGLSPYQYVLQLRVEQAKVQLQRTDDTVTEISLGLGFSSTSQFHRTFLRAVGMTPEKYRAEKR